MIRCVDVPKESEIRKHLAGATLFDAFAAPIGDEHRSALELYIDIMAQTPEWINGLMDIRNKAVGLFGLKNLGQLNNVNPARKPESYRVGDHIGIFSILMLSEREVILSESDKHVDAKVSLFKTTSGNQNLVVMTTVIHVHNLLGRLYMLLVWPVHKLMVPSLLSRGVRTHRNA